MNAIRSKARGRAILLCIASAILATTGARIAPAFQPAPYFPGPWHSEWERREPAELGLDADKLAAAVEFARANFNRNGGYSAANEPYNETIGPTKAPSGMNGVILKRGYIVAEWGDTNEIDMTFSVTKTYLSTTAGLAFDRGLIRDLSDPVSMYVQSGHFDQPHNRVITWHQMLNQTSGWEGSLWDKPDWADRFRGDRRERDMPGQHYRYNDVRVNALALALLHVWRRPLPQVLREFVMDPIGASPTWRWRGYDNSWVNIDGQMMQSVSGGGHWGGGMFISTRDHARFGLLFLNEGNWDGKQLVSKEWVERARTPTDVQPTYGYMNWFLNTPQGRRYRAAPDGNVFFMGAGSNMIWLNPRDEMVTVVRWIGDGQVNNFIARVMEAVGSK
jgi:CubicO group peptidase (beta-lactamase class C family)